MAFNEIYGEIFNTVRSDIEKVNAKLDEAFDVDNSVIEKLQFFLHSPSKRIRSVMTFLYLRAFGIEITEEQIELQAIVELIHNASLIHDDVIDEEFKRRGESSLNSELGNRLAVISGDYLLAVVMKKLCSFNSLELFNIFSRTLENMCSGEIQQHLNLYKIPTIEDYLEKSYLKTGSLFEASITGAMRLAGDTKIIRAVEFGRNFGISFQIRDDLLNVLQPESKDLQSGVYNAPVIFSGSTDITSAGIEKTKDLLNNYLVKADECLSDLEENVYTSALENLLELLQDV